MDPNGRCIADQNGFIDAFYFLSELQKAGAIFEPDYTTAIQLFIGGKADMMINGYWEIKNFKNALGVNLGLAPIPAGEQYPSTPEVESDGIYINPHSNNIKQALDLALYLTGSEGQQILANVGNMPPVRYDVAGIDSIVAEFVKLADSGYILPKDPGILNFRNPFNGALADLLSGQSDAKTAVTKACAEMNKLNGK
jgi:arabinogalactan oligomer/maltooligosaccharide transport system substrate-binding protein